MKGFVLVSHQFEWSAVDHFFSTDNFGNDFLIFLLLVLGRIPFYPLGIDWQICLNPSTCPNIHLFCPYQRCQFEQEFSWTARHQTAGG